MKRPPPQQQSQATSAFRSRILSRVGSVDDETKDRPVAAIQYIKDYAKKVWKEIAQLNRLERMQGKAEGSSRSRSNNSGEDRDEPHSHKKRQTVPSQFDRSPRATVSPPQLDPLRIQVIARKANAHKISGRIGRDVEKDQERRERIQQEQLQAESKLIEINRKRNVLPV